jgi:DNA-binding LacI/PurR family transcriptional regulator
MAVTMRQIAQRIGLSVPTVSLVLNHKPHPLRAETRELVLRAAREMGYRPNGFARAVRQGRFGLVTVVVRCGDDGDGTLPGLLQQGLLAGVRNHDLQLMLAELPQMPAAPPPPPPPRPAAAEAGNGNGNGHHEEPHLPKLLRELSTDGLLFLPGRGCREGMEHLVAEHHLPAVWIGERRATDCAYVDAQDAGQRAARHLIELGHGRIAWLSFAGPEPEQDHAREALAGDLAAMRGAGLEPRALVADEAPVPRRQRAQLVEQLLASAGERPTAILADGPEAALLVQTAAAKLGLTVPDDLSLLLLGDAAPADLIGPALTRLRLPLYRLGEVAVEALTKKIANPAEALPAVAVPYDLVNGESCAAPPTGSPRRAASARGRIVEHAGAAKGAERASRRAERSPPNPA